MSTEAATADMWAADLEDILDLSPMEQQEPGAERKGFEKAARSTLFYLTMAGVGIATLVVGVARTDISWIIGHRFPDEGQSASSQPRRASLNRFRVSAGVDAIRSSNTERDAGSAVASMVQSETPLISGTESNGTRRREVRPASVQGRDQTSRRASDADTAGKDGASMTAAVVGRKIAAAPDLASPWLDPARGTSLPDAKLAGDDVRLASVPLSLLRLSATTDGAQGQQDRNFSDKAGMTLAPANPEKTSRKKRGAIDAIRMLRRQ